MVVVNYFKEKDNDRYSLDLAGIINDSYDILFDGDLIDDAITNDDDFNPEESTLYEVYLERATIAADPIPEPAFCIVYTVKKIHDPNDETWKSKLIRL
ncbi:MAG: hypothetical protein GY793_11880 [Proteobacteria bacterium]|nr:hypothetical protein [Pseudomonadota bacterium]